MEVYQGEGNTKNDNYFVGKFALKGLPVAPRGVPRIELTFKVDTDGILLMSGVEHTTDTKLTLENVKNPCLTQD